VCNCDAEQGQTGGGNMTKQNSDDAATSISANNSIEKMLTHQNGRGSRPSDEVRNRTVKHTEVEQLRPPCSCSRIRKHARIPVDGRSGRQLNPLCRRSTPPSSGNRATAFDIAPVPLWPASSIGRASLQPAGCDRFLPPSSAPCSIHRAAYNVRLSSRDTGKASRASSSLRIALLC
jgi:hypothetical protein